MVIFIIITFIAAAFLIIQGSNEKGAGGAAFICMGIVTLAAAGTLAYLILRGLRRE
ncbi:hypothetical protein [Streptomyces sp. NPDC008317]|uniref:hypothetical protein n=1 Tax=Streptomyces sp. NPDC008317 TaxID=3364827 RepID=UPI0036EECC02